MKAMSGRFLEDVGAVAALEDEIPRRVYEVVRRRRRPVTREEVAAAVGISRRLAAFHLDRLLARGLLTAHYARPPGRSGPGAGRPAKRYAPTDRELRVSIPERRYELLGRLLLDALRTRMPEESPVDAARRVAHERGRELGERVRRERRLRPPGPERALAVVEEVLGDIGFEPHRGESGDLALVNCPFHDLAREAPDLVCAMNQAFVEGVLRGLGNATVEAALTRRPGECCVTLRAPSRGRGDDRPR
jgi:predicted ArsR family transcriptional regulator